MNFGKIILELALIFAGAGVLATIFLFLKQLIILTYILLGVIIGPSGFQLITDAEHIEQLAHLGIILLLFLLGLNLHPDKLLKLFRKTSAVTLATCLVFALLGMITTLLLGFSLMDSLISGTALMFSSTIVSLKLIPTISLHHRHIGELLTSVLLFQDVIAIVLILLLGGESGNPIEVGILLILKLTLLGAFAYMAVKHVIMTMFRRFDVIKEYIFVVSLGWCLLMAEMAHRIELSYETGAFVAGVSIAAFPIALVIAEELKPLREFFLILFFFAIGANFDFLVIQEVLVPGLILATVLLIAKPLVFRAAFQIIKENNLLSKELGVRLGQASEFSLLVAYSAALSGKISAEASNLIQLVVIITFVVSTYRVILKYSTPISMAAARRAD